MNAIVAALEAMKVDDFVKGRLLDSEMKRSVNDWKCKNSTVVFNSNARVVKKYLVCYSCGKRGHYKTVCKLNNNRRPNRLNCYECHISYVYNESNDDKNEVVFEILLWKPENSLVLQFQQRRQIQFSRCSLLLLPNNSILCLFGSYIPCQRRGT